MMKIKFPILTYFLFFLCGSPFAQISKIGTWNGTIFENGSQYAYTLVIQKINGKNVEGRSVSANSSFNCTAFFTGEIEGDKIQIIEQYVISTNYPKKEDVCLMTIALTLKNEVLAGEFYSNNSLKRKCGNGIVRLKYKDSIPLSKKNIKQENKSVAAVEQPLPKREMQQLSIVNENKLDPAIQLNSSPLEKKQNDFTYSSQYALRKIEITNTVHVPYDSVQVLVYDNGIIDGDEITLLVNGKVIVSNRTLTDKPIAFSLLKQNDTEFTIEFFANNLGKIPPNTGLIVIKNHVFYQELTFNSDLLKTNAIKVVLHKNHP